jgi:hypothetical protein
VVVTQWKPGDLLSGASDLASYDFCRSRNWRFCLLPHLHAKLLLIDNVHLFVGSANITAFGLSLVPGGNREVGLCVAATDSDVRTVFGLLEEAIEVSPALFSEIEEWLSKQRQVQAHSQVELRWPVSIAQRITRSPTHLWVADLPWIKPQYLLERNNEAKLKEAIDHDARLFGTKEHASLDSAFRNSSSYRWLVGVLRAEPDQTAYFGRLSQLLHGSLLDDPAPFRKDVKNLLANLLEYVAIFAQPEIKLDCPQQSTRVRLFTVEQQLSAVTYDTLSKF